MGLEIRRVKPDWEPPTEGRTNSSTREASQRYSPDNGWEQWHPHYDTDWLSEWRRWQVGRIRWYLMRPLIWLATMLGMFYMKSYGWPRWCSESYAGDCGGPPQWQSYRPRWSDKERTHFQLYETVSEGTPLSPPMPDVESLSQWCSEKRDIWPGVGNMTYEDWLAFCRSGGWAPSLVSTPEHGLESGVEYVAREERKAETDGTIRS